MNEQDEDPFEKFNVQTAKELMEEDFEDEGVAEKKYRQGYFHGYIQALWDVEKQADAGMLNALQCVRNLHEFKDEYLVPWRYTNNPDFNPPPEFDLEHTNLDHE